MRHQIDRSDVVIAETTVHNPNVYYEVGLAHGIGRPTILICKDANTIPFDLAAINHIVYDSISHLRGEAPDKINRNPAFGQTKAR